MRAFLKKIMRPKQSGQAPRSRQALRGAAYCDQVDAMLRDWDALLADLGAEAAGQTTRVRARYVRCADTFTRRHEEAQRKLDSLRRAEHGEWERARPELERSMEDLRRLVERARIA